MFGSKEEKEKRRQTKALLKSTEARLEQRQKEFYVQVEAYKQSVAEKWEDLETTSQRLAGINMSLNDLGEQGWELVGVTSYSEGMGTLYWHQIYVFKRRIPEFPAKLLAQEAEILDIELEIAAMKKLLEQQ